MPLLSLSRLYLCKAQSAVITSKEYFEEVGMKWFGDNFKDQFFDLEVLPGDVTELAVWKLEQNSLDVPIVAELVDKTEMSVSQFKQFLSDNSESSEWFIFYLRGKDGTLWAVDAFWYTDDDGWRVSADSLGDPDEWSAGHLVVSCN